MLGYKCIAPGCEKMFDSRKGYNTTNLWIGCADIQNGRQLFSRGAGSGDKVRPKDLQKSSAKDVQKTERFQHSHQAAAWCEP
jgi:hypothetical protein